jgi:hypothetical protein
VFALSGETESRSVLAAMPYSARKRVGGYFENCDFLSGETRLTTKARSCEAINGFGRKCHPSLSTSIPSGNPDIKSTLS